MKHAILLLTSLALLAAFGCSSVSDGYYTGPKGGFNQPCRGYAIDPIDYENEFPDGTVSPCDEGLECDYSRDLCWWIADGDEDGSEDETTEQEDVETEEGEDTE